MRFLFIISHDDHFRPTSDLVSQIHGWIQASTANGRRLHGEPLVPATQARTLRRRGGSLQISNGPFSEALEQMCAYELVDCLDMDEAVQLASSHPMVDVATIEVRAIWNDLGVGRADGRGRPA